mmetsp:Transcript_49313/g.145633  ORF Transcript_49313/g.145633 Transcript_49313/m.145633 type:complete len:267 (-) Transcript_49313:183-983(-)
MRGDGAPLWSRRVPLQGGGCGSHQGARRGPPAGQRLQRGARGGQAPCEGGRLRPVPGPEKHGGLSAGRAGAPYPSLARCGDSAAWSRARRRRRRRGCEGGRRPCGVEGRRRRRRGRCEAEGTGCGPFGVHRHRDSSAAGGVRTAPSGGRRRGRLLLLQGGRAGQGEAGPGGAALGADVHLEIWQQPPRVLRTRAASHSGADARGQSRRWCRAGAGAAEVAASAPRWPRPGRPRGPRGPPPRPRSAGAHAAVPEARRLGGEGHAPER